MGIRINKMLGYALTDVKHHDLEMTDTRINLDSWVFNDYIEHPTWNDFEDYVRTAETDEIAKMIICSERNPVDELSYCVVHDAESGHGNVLCIIPPSNFHNWHRYDDIIDYEECALSNDGGYPLVRTLDHGIYPYTGYQWVGDKPHNIPQNKTFTFWQTFKRLMDVYRSKNGGQEVVEEALTNLAGEAGCSTFEELDSNVVPLIPLEGIHFCNFTQMFTSEKVIKQLRPVLYQFWG